MDAIELLKSDHGAVKGLFERFRSAEEAGDRDAMSEVAGEVCRELEAHTAIEEEIFYPGIREADEDLGEDVAEAVQEHHVVKVLMEELGQVETGGEEWVAKFTVLMENVEHHVEEEEGEMFPEVREALDGDALDRMGREMEQRKGEITSGGATAGGDGRGDIDLTKDELYEKAKDLEIEGRSSMSKEELAEAVARAEG